MEKQQQQAQEAQKKQVITNKKRFDTIIDEIETTLDCGYKVPPFGSVVKVKEVRSHLDGLRKSVYEAVQEADKIVNNKEKVLSEAKAEAEELIRRRQAEVSRQPVLQEAEGYAKKMLIQAKEESERMKQEAEKFQREMKENSYKYADRIFDEVEKTLNEKRKTIMTNRNDLKSVIEDGRREANRQNVERKQA